MNAFNAMLMASQLPILEINSDGSVPGEASTREATNDSSCSGVGRECRRPWPRSWVPSSWSKSGLMCGFRRYTHAAKFAGTTAPVSSERYMIQMRGSNANDFMADRISRHTLTKMINAKQLKRTEIF